ncbi:MAG: endonuclease/exonuclease/phosphatase family protein [Luteolibacter sp.]|jgi:endonuclease/exonuclease/phosphatase family metal-dependent hydrolase
MSTIWKLHLLSLATIFLLPSLVHAEDAKKPATTLDVISWNVEWYPGKSRFARGAEMAAHAAHVNRQFAKMKPDIFLAQEMRDWNAFALLCDHVEGLRPATVSAFTSEETGEYWNQQLGIGAKLYVAAAWSEPWREGREITPRRGFNVAVLRLPGSFDHLLVYNVHLKSNRSANEEDANLNFRTREESVRQLIAHVADMKERVFKGRIKGVVIAGDFNTNHDGQFGDDRTIAMMEEAGFHNTWKNVPRENRLTWRGSDRFEATTFDYIFTQDLPEADASLIPVEEGSSDHWPVRITLNF